MIPDADATDGDGVAQRHRLATAIAAIDLANGDDPNEFEGTPRALAQGRLASEELSALDDDPSELLQLASRAHHLKRWALARVDYPEGRAGYLRWRRDNKAVQADAAGAILSDAGYEPKAVDRMAELLNRRRLASDPETQLLEDVACLVFLQTEFDPMIARLGHDRMVHIVKKTLTKMSPAAIERAGTLSLSPAAGAVLADAAELYANPAVVEPDGESSQP